MTVFDVQQQAKLLCLDFFKFLFQIVTTQIASKHVGNLTSMGWLHDSVSKKERFEQLSIDRSFDLFVYTRKLYCMLENIKNQ